MEAGISWLSTFGQSMPPHGHCYLWNDTLVGLHVLSDAAIVAAYYSIPVALIYLIRRRRDLRFNYMFWLFSLFIFACGTTHLMNIWNVWHGDYWLSGSIKAVTGVVSLLTAVLIWPMIPKVLALPSNRQLTLLNDQLQQEVAEKERSQRHLEALSQKLERRVAERTAQLENSERRYRTLVEGLSAVVWHTDVDGRMAEPQPSWGTYTGQAWEQYRGFGWVAAIAPEDRDRVEAEWRSAVARRAPYRAACRLWNDTHQCYRNVRVRGMPIFRGDNLLSEWVGTVEDVTEATLAEEKFRIALESAPTGMMIIDSAGHIEYANEEAVTLFGYGKGELEGMTVEQLMPEDFRGRHVQFRQDYYRDMKKRAMGENLDLYALHKNGRAIPVEIGLNPIVAGSRRTILCSISDITERRRNEQRLAEKNALLEASNRELEQFAYVASHDLKEPIRKINAFSSMLKRRAESKLGADELELLDKSINASVRMGRLVDDLLFYSRIGNAEVEADYVDLNKLVQDVLAEFDLDLRRNNVQVSVETLPQITGVRSQLEQVFANLLSNAVKFCRDAPVPEILIGARETEDSRVVYVQDNGIGIDPAQHGRIFGIFERLHGRSEYDGSGIGLAICKRIMDRHLGQIEVHSEPGQGARFELHFSREAVYV